MPMRGKNHSPKTVHASRCDVDNVMSCEEVRKRDSVVLTTGWLVQILPRKEVIQPHVLVRLPCYDFTPLAEVTLGALRRATSGTPHSVGVTGGVYNP
jgi:hypothetical protein